MQLKLDWKAVHRIQKQDSLSAVLEAHGAVFKEELGMIKGTTAKLHVDPQVPPRFCKPRPVPFALRKKVEDELERLERNGIIQPKQFSEWAAPIVPVLKVMAP